MGRWLLGGVCAAVVMFLWGFLFWAVLGGGEQIKPLPNEDAVRDALRGGALPTGAYYLPAMGPQSEERHREGPIVKIYYRAEGGPDMSAERMVAGFAHLFGSALLAGWLLSLVPGTMRSYTRRVGFVFVLGLFAAYTIPLGDSIWWHHPLRFQITLFIYHALNWLLAGLVLAAFIKSPLTARRQAE